MKKQLKLADLEVKSFVTSLNEKEHKTIEGGATPTIYYTVAKSLKTTPKDQTCIILTEKIPVSVGKCTKGAVCDALSGECTDGAVCGSDFWACPW